MYIKNDSDWNLGPFPANDEELLVEFMVSDILSSLIKPEENKKENGVKVRVPKDSAGPRETTSAKRKRSISSSKSSSSDEPSNKKTKGKKGRSSRLTTTTKGFKRHFAKHNYHDYARLKPSQLEMDHIKASRGGVSNPFPAVIHGMMEEAEENGFADIISWQPHGRAFFIREPKAFVAKVLPKYFKHSKLSSFQRQLSLYGFVRLTHDGPDRGAYYHECFLRGRPFLCPKIQRTRVKGTWVRTSSSPDSEPDFYVMEAIVDVDDIDSCSTETVLTASGESDDQSHSSAETYEINPLPVTSRSMQQAPVNFLDINSRTVLVSNKPPAGAALQPPPALPTRVLIAPASAQSKPPVKDPITTSLLKKGIPANNSWQPKIPALEVPSLPLLVGGGLISYAIFDDDELACFLTDVDLDTDFDNEDDIQSTTV
jgi:hypothetical protein